MADWTNTVEYLSILESFPTNSLDFVHLTLLEPQGCGRRTRSYHSFANLFLYNPYVGGRTMSPPGIEELATLGLPSDGDPQVKKKILAPLKCSWFIKHSSNGIRFLGLGFGNRYELRPRRDLAIKMSTTGRKLTSASTGHRPTSTSIFFTLTTLNGLLIVCCGTVCILFNSTLHSAPSLSYRKLYFLEEALTA
ncbi:unnamed protein product [Nesidiocoris tenuis]|uniref:Uncharacterized protein n=1 Tax=Nesidiocoris tenuis TaxID=355587 RepID=A0A6H5GIB3_9HEMI|nr:unnamed protein product [Nesidiocoris tenuis]